MHRAWFFCIAISFCSVSVRAQSAEDDAVAQTKKDLLPRPVTLQGEGILLSDALAQLSRQTGNPVSDRRQVKTDLKLKLALDNSTFWQAVDAIAKAAGCGISTYQADGQVALVDAPMPNLLTQYQGIFRIQVKRLGVVRNEETGTHVCTVTLEIAWEPRFEPLYLEVGPMEATFAADNKGIEQRSKVAGQGKISVAGWSAREVDISLPAPKRSSPSIKSLEGRLQLTGPGKMLTFTFPQLKSLKKTDSPLRQTKEGVEVSLVELKTTSSRWSAEIHIVNAPGNPAFESYQSWLANNRIFLEKGTGTEKNQWIPRLGDDLVDKQTANQAIIQYSFHVPSKGSKGAIGDWSLVYRTPGRIVEMEVPLAFKNIPLP
jgi:hypothetical protein